MVGALILDTRIEQTEHKTMQDEKKKHEHGVPEGYVGMAELRAKLRKCRATIWQMVHDGRLPKPFKDGSRNVWERLEIERWIQNKKFLTKWHEKPGQSRRKDSPKGVVGGKWKD